jgi:hypothetical protein
MLDVRLSVVKLVQQNVVDGVRLRSIVSMGSVKGELEWKGIALAVRYPKKRTCYCKLLLTIVKCDSLRLSSVIVRPFTADVRFGVCGESEGRYAHAPDHGLKPGISRVCQSWSTSRPHVIWIRCLKL